MGENGGHVRGLSLKKMSKIFSCDCCSGIQNQVCFFNAKMSCKQSCKKKTENMETSFWMIILSACRATLIF